MNNFSSALPFLKARDFIPRCTYLGGSGFRIVLFLFLDAALHTLKPRDFQGHFRSLFDINMLLFLLLFCWAEELVVFYFLNWDTNGREISHQAPDEQLLQKP